MTSTFESKSVRTASDSVKRQPVCSVKSKVLYLIARYTSISSVCFNFLSFDPASQLRQSYD